MNTLPVPFPTGEKPIFALGPNERMLQNKIENHPMLSSMNISDDIWAKHCRAVNEVLRPVSSNIKQFANADYDGLLLHDSFIKFGSSRDGLKVVDALEFDCVMLFNIQGMQITPIPAKQDNTGRRNLGFMKIRVDNGYELIQRYQWLVKREILVLEHGNYYFNTRNLQERVFKSLVDKTRQNLNDQLKQNSSKLAISRICKPPTFDIHIPIELNSNKDKGISDLFDTFCRLEGAIQAQGREVRPRTSLDIDLVPALLIRHDRVPNPNYPESDISCPVYAVMKWAHKGIYMSSADQKDQLWREDTSGYEKHIIDIAVQRDEDSQRYLMTACRILKSYVANLPGTGTNQLHVVMASQYLKTICFHCFTMLTIPRDQNSLSGVGNALGYFLCFLDLCIKTKNLPHFFYGNPWLVVLFPDSSFGNENEQKNLYQSISDETFRQARSRFEEMKSDLEGLFTEQIYLNPDCIERFRDLLGMTR